ncbi:MAG: bifunctional diaminohydroxyphosphoribosylaminopyrimidine deaminase/5-amino-6-(5-phosphoribosylamino)uracil reductase RibD, partial [Emcibacteraceae bacterium]|nr:bifunctional diaminohydroxyphosphoribosylaminopyrimidine deaminase/5-amino-6-(5-phosphoribosylamino)uracil reductase RibD [Emcibacteraceae bacterium]
MKKNNLTYTPEDVAYMKMALDLSRRGLGHVAPNPSVGCVLVKDGHIIGRGWTGQGGRPHAEVYALNSAGVAHGATAYVSLEPCAHFGKTPPCAETLVNADITKIFIATGDPDPRVSGKGIAILEDAGIEVCEGLLKEDADLINKGFFQVISENKPLVTIKLATSKDGKIAKKHGEQTWVTGSKARMRGHLYRANHDAIMVGINTVLVDDPSLDCRIFGLENRSPIRVVLDSELRLPLESKVCDTSIQPTWVMTQSY